MTVKFNEVYETMTVVELMEALSNMPENLPVLTEGCDCNGGVSSVTLEKLYRDSEYPIHYTNSYIDELEARRQYVYIRRSIDD